MELGSTICMKRLAREEDLVAFPNLPELAIAHNTLHHDNSVQGVLMVIRWTVHFGPFEARWRTDRGSVAEP